MDAQERFEARCATEADAYYRAAADEAQYELEVSFRDGTATLYYTQDGLSFALEAVSVGDSNCEPEDFSARVLEEFNTALRRHVRAMDDAAADAAWEAREAA